MYPKLLIADEDCVKAIPVNESGVPIGAEFKLPGGIYPVLEQESVTLEDSTQEATRYVVDYDQKLVAVVIPNSDDDPLFG